MMLRYLDKRVHPLVPVLLKRRNQATKNIKAMKSSSLKKIILAHFGNRINKNMINTLNLHPNLIIFPKGLKKTKGKKTLLTPNLNKKSPNTNLEPLSINKYIQKQYKLWNSFNNFTVFLFILEFCTEFFYATKISICTCRSLQLRDENQKVQS